MPLKIKSVIKISVICVLMIFIFQPTFAWMKARFTEADTYYSHGFLVPLVAAYLLYRRKDELVNTPARNSTAGFFLIAPGLVIHLMAFRWGVSFISGFSFIIVLFGLFLILWGKEVTKKNMFALLFLFFMVPLPKVLIIALSFKLKLFAAQAATNIINMFGIPALRMGSTVQLSNTALTVGDPCSGLRSLIALLALGAIYAYISGLNRPKKFFLFLSAVPIAIIANIFRIVLLLLVAYVYGAEAATGKFHDFSAFVVFAVALIFLTGFAKVLSWEKRI